jgi:hypothetical protein
MIGAEIDQEGVAARHEPKGNCSVPLFIASTEVDFSVSSTCLNGSLISARAATRSSCRREVNLT